jgi:hypothetical protein
LALVAAAAAAQAEGFAFVTTESVAPIVVAAGEPEYVRLAAEDLASDVAKITGRRPDVVPAGAAPDGPCVMIATKAGGAWESYRVEARGSRLVIEGGDARGTMFGVYAFAARYLQVDPLWYWSGREPAKRTELTWPSVLIVAASPAFKFRGWFINDEDLLTFWKPGGKRALPYKFYSNMMHRETLRAVAEALVRSRYNLVIPASFIDILNPEEEALAQECARRGLFLTMHHQEPLGVSAWTFLNYWKARGRELKYSYVSQPEEIREVWRVYAKKWAQYPDVIWQLGLRGKGDRPMWQADDKTPQSDADRGRIISEAMADQVRILDEVCPRRPRLLSTTLWAEGSLLNQKGFLKIPEGTIIVFADNSPGWKWQRDFYETPRSAKNTYGVYYHHALIGCGPHLAQAVPPRKTCELLREAEQKGAAEYVILNVSNIREFVLGISATSELTWRLSAFEPDAWLNTWVDERFSTKRGEIASAYRTYFNAYQLHEKQNVPFLLDGQMLSRGGQELKEIERARASPKGGQGAAKEERTLTTEQAIAKRVDVFWEGLSDMHPQALERDVTMKMAIIQQRGFEAALSKARTAAADLAGAEAAFLNDNLCYPSEVMARLSAWFERVLAAREALDTGDIPAAVRALETAAASLAGLEPLAAAYCHGKWKAWYGGVLILDVPAARRRTQSALEAVKKGQ